MAQVAEPQENESKNEEIVDNGQKEVENVPKVPDVQYLSGNVLVQWIKERQKSGDKANTKYLIVDVRDDDYGPQKIMGAINLPRHELTSKYDTSLIVDLIEKTGTECENIVFHCMYSQVRGPASAKYYHRFRKEHYPKYPMQNVLILQGGYGTWRQKHPELCEDV